MTRAAVHLRESGCRRVGLVALFVGLFFLPAALLAQQPSDPPGQDHADDTQNASGSPKPIPVMSLVTGELLESPISPLHWGRVSLMSGDFFYLYDRNSISPPYTVGSDRLLGVTGLLVYSLQRKRAGVTFQYQPFVMASKESYQASGLGQSLSFNTYRMLRRSWLLSLSDNFQSMPPQSQFMNPGFTQDFTTGLITTKPLLAVGQEYLSNNLSLSLEHPLGARDILTWVGSYGLNYVSLPYGSSSTLQQPPANLPGSDTNQTLGTSLTWTHAWKQGRELGLSYAFSRTVLNHSSPGSLYYSLLGSYQQQIRPSLMMGISFGPALQIQGAGFGNSAATVTKALTYEGSFNLLKTFRRSGISVYLTRSEGFVGVISNQLSNQAYVSYTRQFGRRLSGAVGVGYLEQDSLNTRAEWGRSVWAETSYSLSRSWSTVAEYGYTDVRGGPYGLGRQLIMSFGLRWMWAPGNRSEFGADNQNVIH